eukprot:CAMPEP_0118949526 /NCGR_PEP_ID=MMETSP1169-20130426/49806_1 /TAXON_ID=36882 /ORGANISM="Pyramimonas obovata, Strain CCMP722" /LENGTH=233 /DNA_ID=CAMNT_0006896189 /DNA_START=127 /DNA_END=824 /DNA_ORIENTATION=+
MTRDTELETGDQLCLEHVDSGLSLQLLVEQKGKVYLLARTSQPYHRLQCSPQKVGTVLWKISRLNANAAAMWHIEFEAASSSCNLLRIRSAASFLEEVNCLGFSDREIALTRDTDSGSVWRRVQPTSTPVGWGPSPSDSLHQSRCPSELSGADEAAEASSALRKRGFVVLPALIPPHKVSRALQYMNHHLGSADLSSDLDPSGLGSEFLNPTTATDDSSNGDAANNGTVVKLG